MNFCVKHMDLDDIAFWLSLDIEARPQLQVWRNNSWIPEYPIWELENKIPYMKYIGPVYGEPRQPKLTYKLLKVHQDLSELRDIWNVQYHTL